jgi:hypothetical protein
MVYLSSGPGQSGDTQPYLKQLIYHHILPHNKGFQKSHWFLPTFERGVLHAKRAFFNVS